MVTLLMLLSLSVSWSSTWRYWYVRHASFVCAGSRSAHQRLHLTRREPNRRTCWRSRTGEDVAAHPGLCCQLWAEARCVCVFWDGWLPLWTKVYLKILLLILLLIDDSWAKILQTDCKHVLNRFSDFILWMWIFLDSSLTHLRASSSTLYTPNNSVT